MKRILFFTANCFTTALQAQEIPKPSQALVDAMQKVSFIEGNWKGTGWIQMGPERHEFNQQEQVQLKVNGAILQIDGLGVDAANPELKIHQAFGIITYNMDSAKYRMQAFRGDGAEIVAYLKPLSSNSFEWGFNLPMVGDMRYIITVENNLWTETGEISRNGQWFKFLEMKLNKQ